MRTTEQENEEIIEERKVCNDFLDKLGTIVLEARKRGINTGMMLGALEIVKMKCFREADDMVMKKMKDDEEQD